VVDFPLATQIWFIKNIVTFVSVRARVYRIDSSRIVTHTYFRFDFLVPIQETSTARVQRCVPFD